MARPDIKIHRLQITVEFDPACSHLEARRRVNDGLVGRLFNYDCADLNGGLVGTIRSATTPFKPRPKKPKVRKTPESPKQFWNRISGMHEGGTTTGRALHAGETRRPPLEERYSKHPALAAPYGAYDPCDAGDTGETP